MKKCDVCKKELSYKEQKLCNYHYKEFLHFTVKPTKKDKNFSKKEMNDFWRKWDTL